jgi:hypothetical protein
MLFKPRIGPQDYRQEAQHLRSQLVELVEEHILDIIRGGITLRIYDGVAAAARELTDRFNIVTGAHETCSVWVERDRGAVHICVGNAPGSGRDILYMISCGFTDGWFAESYKERIQ